MFEWTSTDGTESITSRAVNWITLGLWPGVVTIIDADALVIADRVDEPRAVTFHRNAS